MTLLPWGLVPSSTPHHPAYAGRGYQREQQDESDRYQPQGSSVAGYANEEGADDQHADAHRGAKGGDAAVPQSTSTEALAEGQ